MDDRILTAVIFILADKTVFMFRNCMVFIPSLKHRIELLCHRNPVRLEPAFPLPRPELYPVIPEIDFITFENEKLAPLSCRMKTGEMHHLVLALRRRIIHLPEIFNRRDAARHSFLILLFGFTVKPRLSGRKMSAAVSLREEDQL
jgi:hypothetical protein